MKTQVEFKSNSFPAYPNETKETNPGRWGKKLAEYLNGELEKYGYQVIRYYAEDWGWQIELKNDRFPIYIGLGNFEEYENGFTVFITPEKPFIRKMFKKISTAEDISKLSDTIDKILRTNSDIWDVKWWAEDKRKFG